MLDVMLRVSRLADIRQKELHPRADLAECFEGDKLFVEG